jgi:hypothetical protein
LRTRRGPAKPNQGLVALVTGSAISTGGRRRVRVLKLDALLEECDRAYEAFRVDLRRDTELRTCP